MDAKPAFEDGLGKAIKLRNIAPVWAKRQVEKKPPFPLSFRWFQWYFELKIH